MNYDDIKVGDSFTILNKEEITRIQLVKYAGASGDFNPLHTVEEVGNEAGTGIISHGMLVMGMAGEAITKWVPRKNVKKFNFRFQKVTLPGESIKIHGKVLEKQEDNLFVGEVVAMNEKKEIKGTGKFEFYHP